MIAIKCYLQKYIYYCVEYKGKTIIYALGQDQLKCEDILSRPRNMGWRKFTTEGDDWLYNYVGQNGYLR